MNFEQSDPRIPRIIARLRRVQQQREKRIALLATALWLTDIEQASPLERPHIVFTLSKSYTGWAMGGAYPNDAPPESSELGSSIWRCERAMFESSWKAEKLTEALWKHVCADVAAEVERRIAESVKPKTWIGEYEFDVPCVTPRFALLDLNRAYGWESGLVPLDAVVEPDHAEATYRLMRPARVRLLARFNRRGEKWFFCEPHGRVGGEYHPHRKPWKLVDNVWICGWCARTESGAPGNATEPR
jgi:hypothetical protein